MKKAIILISVFFISFICFPQQVLDNAQLKCQYAYTWQNDTLTGKTRDDLLILKIGKDISKSYSYYSFQVDSISAMPNGDKIAGKMISDALKSGDFMKGNYPHKRMRTYVYKNNPHGRMTVTDGISLQDYIYEDELNAQNWQFADSTKTILDYNCQMATCDFRGRQWTAWFAPDIPISDGPWKFGGLPGLIMEVYDLGSQYHFTIIGLQKVENEPIIFSETTVGSKRFEKTNRKDFLKANKNFQMDVNGYIRMETGIDLSTGKPDKIMRYDLIERDYK